MGGMSLMDTYSALSADEHRRGCLCVRCETADHPDECVCWACESRRLFFEQEPPRRRVLVASDEVAEHLKRLGWTQRRVAAETGERRCRREGLVPGPADHARDG